MLLSEALKRFTSDYLAIHGRSSSTQENYELAVLSFTRIVGDKSISSITPQDVLLWRRGMEKTLELGTIRNYLSKLKNILKFTNKKGFTNFDLDDLHLPKLPPGLPKFLYESEIEALVAASGNLRNKLLILLMFTSGVRASELVGLNKSDVDGRALYIRKGKGDTSRVVFMSPRTKMFMEQYLATRVDRNDVLLLSYRNGRLESRYITKILKKIAREAGVIKPVHAHVMRHSCATHMVRNGVDTSHVQKLLGHAYISTTQIYVHLTNSDVEEAHAKVFS